MLRLTIVSILIAVAVARTPKIRPMLDGRIVGGEPTTIEKFPHQLGLEYIEDDHKCGASIISPTHALTAAHCTDGKLEKFLKVRAGSSIREVGGQVVQVEKICQHPDFDGSTFDNDVSILKLAAPLNFTNGVQAIPLVKLGLSPKPGTIATVSGWGKLSSNDPKPDQLHKVDVPRVSQADCREAYGASAITNNMMCFGYTNGGKDACQGDSGGPLVANGEQVGVVSWGNDCASAQYPGIYVDLSAPSIINHIKSCLN